jgi:hypothetical protein
VRQRHKFRAVLTQRDGQTFHSKKEAEFYDGLVLLRERGEVVFFLRQVPFHLPGGVKYIVDFQVFWDDGTVSFIDVKGVRTRAYVRNKKQVETLYPVTIEEADKMHVCPSRRY